MCILMILAWINGYSVRISLCNLWCLHAIKSDAQVTVLLDCYAIPPRATCVSVQSFSRNEFSGLWSRSFRTVYRNALPFGRQPLTMPAYSTDHMSGLRRVWCVAPPRMTSIAYAESMQNSRGTLSTHWFAMMPSDQTSAAALPYSNGWKISGATHQAVPTLFYQKPFFHTFERICNKMSVDLNFYAPNI